MGLLKLLSANEIIAQVITFILVLACLKVFLWGRILKILDERKSRIESEFRNIEELKIQAQKKAAEYAQKIVAINDEAQLKIRQAVEEGRVAAESIRKRAHEQAQEIIDNAKASMKQDVMSAREAMKEEIVDITVKACEDIIEEKLTEEQDRRLVEEFLKRIDEVK